MHAHIERYRKLGFRDLTTDSGTGSFVLVNQELDRVVKFNQDPAYDKFIEFALVHPMTALPAIFHHEKPLGEFKPLSNDEYTVTELELLLPMSSEEQRSVLSWINRAVAFLKVGGQSSAVIDDPHNLKSAFDGLRAEALRIGVSLDVLKGTNFMKRKKESHSCYVFIDPFN